LAKSVAEEIGVTLTEGFLVTHDDGSHKGRVFYLHLSDYFSTQYLKSRFSYDHQT